MSKATANMNANRPGNKGTRYAPSYFKPYVAKTLDEAKDEIKRAIALKKGVERPVPIDIVDWAQSRFYTPQTGKLIELQPHQQAILRLAFTRTEEGWLPYRLLVYSTIKQSGKSTIAGIIERWYAETQRRMSELYCIGNDMDQAKTRSFREIRQSIELTPGFDKARDRLPGEWNLETKETMRCLRTGTVIRALPVDPKGEAGGKPALQTWTELWGIDSVDGQRFWDELTPIPTIPDSMRIVETYAGYLQESELLYQIYTNGLAGHQLTSGELSERTGCPLGVFEESPNPDDLVPIWENKAAEMLMYWDSGLKARRMPWQKDERGKRYYQQQELDLLPQAYQRLHENEWVTSTSSFIQKEMWQGCYDARFAIPVEPGDNTPLVVGVDAATTGDCFAIVVVSRHPDNHDYVAVRASRIWNPKESGGVVDYDEPLSFLRFLCEGGHYATEGWPFHPKSLGPENASRGCVQCGNQQFDVPGLNVVHVAYDPYQLEQPMQKLQKDQVAWCEPFLQAGERLKADRGLYDAILRKEIAHGGNETLTSHILNAGAKVQKDQDSTLRLVKVAPNRKIDGAVALSMATARCRWLVL